MAKNKNEKKDEKVVPVENLETMKDVENENAAVENDTEKKEDAAVENDTEKKEDAAVENDTEKKEDAAVKIGIVNCDKLRVRKGPSTDAEILKYLKKGDEVVIESEDDKDFYKIAAGFVMKEFISLKI